MAFTLRPVFADLLGHDGVEEILNLRSRFGFMAFHGGSLEQGTDPIARAAADRCGASIYAVVQPPELRWHVPSSQVSAAQSPALAAFLNHVTAVVAVHGYGRPGFERTLLLGGRGRYLAAHTAGRLRAALPDYDVVDDLDHIPAGLRGMHAGNPVNGSRGVGVQLELSVGSRAEPIASRVIDALAAAATNWPGTVP